MIGFDVSPETLALLIPIIAVMGGMTLAIIGTIYHNRQEELEHKERIIAMEKGLPIPERPEPVKNGSRLFLGLLGWGLVISFLSLGIIISVSVSEGLKMGLFGLIPLGIGLGLLVCAFEARKDSKGSR